MGPRGFRSKCFRLSSFRTESVLETMTFNPAGFKKNEEASTQRKHVTCLRHPTRSCTRTQLCVSLKAIDREESRSALTSPDLLLP